MSAVKVRVELPAGPVRDRPHRHGHATLPAPVVAIRGTGAAGGATGASRQLQSAARASAIWPPCPRRSAFPGLALLILLCCWGPIVDAAYDPMVEAVQEALTERGFEPGEIDGAMGSRTRRALRDFQRSVGLPPTGEIDAATITALGLEPTDSGEKPPAGVSPPTPDTGSGTAPEAEHSGTEPARAVPRAEPTPAEPPRAAPRAEPTHAEPPRAAPAPKPVLRFSTLGWHAPQSGAEALERFVAIGAPRDFKPGSGSLFVPKAELVFVLLAGERIPGLNCDPGAGRLAVEFVFGPDGPVIFTPAAGAELCQMGIGIALEVGRTLEMRPIDWGDARYPQGTVRVTGEGLRYID